MFNANKRVRMIYFEDIQDGEQPGSAEIVVNGKEMLEYNRKYDPWPFHVDEGVAMASPFGGLIASAGYTISLAYLLSHQVYNSAESTWAFLGGFDSQMNFPVPVYAKDKLQYTLEVMSKRFSSKPGRGLVNIRETLANQNGDIVFIAKSIVLVATRPVKDRAA